MLTIELLNANTALSGLTDEQKQTIVALSQNDEASVIASKTGKIYGDLDTDILSASGIGKNGTEKTYDYAKRVIAELKGKAESADALQTQIRSLTQKNTALEKSIAEGNGNEQLQKELKQVKADFANVQNSYSELQKKNEELSAQYERNLWDLRVDGAIQSAIGAIKFKADIPESATKVLLQQAVEKVKGMNPQMIDDGMGGKMLAFADNTGAILRNPDNVLKPFSATELLNRELDTMGILDKGRQQSGAGTQAPTPASANAGISIEGARTRIEANDMITNILIAQGLNPASKEFTDAMTQAWKDNNVSSLPEK